MTSLKAGSVKLPARLLARAQILADEPSWSAGTVAEVITWLAGAGLAVVGVEVWRARGAAPVWIASSDYPCEPDSSWPKCVESCAREALAFVRRFEGEPGALFNLTWAGRDEAGLQ